MASSPQVEASGPCTQDARNGSRTGIVRVLMSERVRNIVFALAISVTAVLTVTTTDADLPADTITYTISGGADAGAFTLNATSGVCSAGFITTQLPAPSAGASFQHAIRIGKFHGMICPTTPSGS